MIGTYSVSQLSFITVTLLRSDGQQSLCFVLFVVSSLTCKAVEGLSGEAEEHKHLWRGCTDTKSTCHCNRRYWWGRFSGLTVKCESNLVGSMSDNMQTILCVELQQIMALICKTASNILTSERKRIFSNVLASP